MLESLIESFQACGLIEWMDSMCSIAYIAQSWFCLSSDAFNEKILREFDDKERKKKSRRLF